MLKKSFYPVCLFLLTAILCGFSILEKQLDAIYSLTYLSWPMWTGLVCYFIVGGVLALTFAVKKRAKLRQSTLAVCNIIFGICNVCLYFYFCMNPVVSPNRVFLIFGGLLLFSAPLKLKQVD